MKCLSLSVCTPYLPSPNSNTFRTNYYISYEILRGSHAIQGGLCIIHFNYVPSNIPKWQTFNFLRLMQNLHQSSSDHEILYAVRPS
jgi:hypothetical protein